MKRKKQRSQGDFEGLKICLIKGVDNMTIRIGFDFGSTGNCGKTIRFETDLSKCPQQIFTKISNKILVCRVLLGKSKSFDGPNSNLNPLALQQEGYDSFFCHGNAES